MSKHTVFGPKLLVPSAVCDFYLFPYSFFVCKLILYFQLLNPNFHCCLSLFGLRVAGTSAIWTELESACGEDAPAGRCGHSACLCPIKGKSMIALFGGDLTGAGKGANDLWLYDIAKDSWRRVEDFAGEPPCPRWK